MVSQSKSTVEAASVVNRSLTAAAVLICAVAATIGATQPSLAIRSIVADRVMTLTRESVWIQVASVPIKFATFHPQGMVKIGDTFYVSSVEVKFPAMRFAQATGGFDRDTGEGIGHLFKIDKAGNLVAETKLGEGGMYHPGGIDYDGNDIWVPVAEYRPDSRSIIYKVNPLTLGATEVLRFADHIGAIVHDTDDDTLHGVSWGSRRFYRWKLGKDGKVLNPDAPPISVRTINPSHYVDYQDCKYTGRHQMLCTGLTELRQRLDAEPFRLGGIELINLTDSRPLHQVPVLLWTSSGLDMTHNPVWIEPNATGLRAYFMPEDDKSTIYVYDVGTTGAR
jgi:Family of unknown function (DUF6454)